MHHRLCVVMQHHLNVVGPQIAKFHCPSLEVPFSSASGKRGGRAMKRGVAQSSTLRNDAVEQDLSKPALGEPGARRRLNVPETVTDTAMFNLKERRQWVG